MSEDPEGFSKDDGPDPNQIRRVLSNERGVKLELMGIDGDVVRLRETYDLTHPQVPLACVTHRNWKEQLLADGLVPMRDIRIPLIQLRKLFGE